MGKTQKTVCVMERIWEFALVLLVADDVSCCCGMEVEKGEDPERL